MGHPAAWVQALLARLWARPAGQAFLERMVVAAQQIMGIGSASHVETSGERAILERLRAVPGECWPLCIFDVGANHGQFLALALECLRGLPLEIHCFEPGSRAYGELEANFGKLCRHHDGLPGRVRLNHCGLGRQAGEADLYFDSPGSPLASLSRRDLDFLGIDFSLSERIHLDTVDHYCLAGGTTRIDLLKLDVEGHELDVLHGAERMFREKAVRMVTFEFGGCNIDSRSYFRDFFHFFRKQEMQLFRITPSGYLAPLPAYREMDEQFRTTNFVAWRATGAGP